METPNLLQTVESRSYTHEEVLSIISRYHPTTTDYLIQTYLTIFDIPSDNPLHHKYLRRFNNIIFNNLKKIIEELTTKIFYEKSLAILNEELASVTYISCIFPHNPTFGPWPIILQFFTPTNGIEHRILSFLSSPFELNTTLLNHHLIPKLVGYCGDFSYNDPGVANYKTDHFISLNLLKEGTIRYLPYCDGFVSKLFDVLVDYLPENVTTCLISLGEALTGTSCNARCIQDLVAKYKSWLNNGGKPHLLLTDYTNEVIENFGLLSAYLERFRCLPRSIEALLCNVLQRFLLVFMREVFERVDQIKLTDNCALMYYHQLVQIRELFSSYEQNNYLPPKALLCFHKETEELIQNNIIDAAKDENKINELFKEIMQVTNITYVRAVEYISSLLDSFEDLYVFNWVMLKRVIVQDDVHQAYHLVCNENCSKCPKLAEEVKEINAFIEKFPLVDLGESLAVKWMFILQSCKSVTLVAKLLEYVFSLPASFAFVGVGGNDQSRLCKEMVKLNWSRMKHEEVVGDIEGFFGEEFMEQSRQVVKENQITTLFD